MCPYIEVQLHYCVIHVYLLLINAEKGEFSVTVSIKCVDQFSSVISCEFNFKDKKNQKTPFNKL